MVLKICRMFSYKSFLLQSLYNHQMSRHISECSITNPQESRHRHPHPSMNYFLSCDCVHWHLVETVVLQTTCISYISPSFNILKIATFNKLPCFVQPKSSNASVFFFPFWNSSRNQHMAFVISSNAPYISFIIIATNITIIRKKFLASVMSSLSIELSAVSHVAARYRATLCFAVDTLSPFHWSPTNVQCSV